VELFVFLVPFSLNVEDSGLNVGSIGSSLNDSTKWSSLSGVGDTSNSDLVVASWVESVDCEGLLGGLSVDPDTSSVNLVRYLPCLVSVISPCNSEGVGGLLGNFEARWLDGWSSAWWRRSFGRRSHWNSGRGVGDGQEGGSDNDVGV